jgi:predicted Zn-dependent protease with MMP-like domain
MKGHLLIIPPMAGRLSSIGFSDKMRWDIFRCSWHRREVVMERARFESLVMKAVEGLPPEFQQKLENVDIVVEDWPGPAELKRGRPIRRIQLLGLYHGVPQTRRGQGYGLVLPDKISIFQRPIEAQGRTDREIEAKITEVVRHEIAHHFGLDDETLREIEDERKGRR